MNWTRQTPTFNFKDKFVLNHPCLNIYLKKVHNEVYTDMKKLLPIKPWRIVRKFNK